MKFAYADPPYVGQALKHYGPDAAEVDHAALFKDIVSEFPDGWALSCSSPSLPMLTAMLERDGFSALRGDYRIGAWVKPFASFKPGVNPAFAWEPVIWMGGRSGKARGLRLITPTVRDFVSCNITLKKGLSGAKPELFCDFVFDLLGARKGDDLIDLFPGTGIVRKRFLTLYEDCA